MQFSLDGYDLSIVRALEQNGALTNAQLSELVNLSPSQCSRRRIRLETEGVIEGYHARLNYEAMGLFQRVVVRVSLNSHSSDNAKDFADFLNLHDEVREAYSVCGNADYVLIVQCESLAHFADFIHSKLLQQSMISRIRSEIVLKDIKRPNTL